MGMKQEEDYSVTWSEVIGIVDKLIERNEPMSMGEVESAVRKAWKIIFDDRCKKYMVEFEQEGLSYEESDTCSTTGCDGGMPEFMSAG